MKSLLRATAKALLAVAVFWMALAPLGAHGAPGDISELDREQVGATVDWTHKSVAKLADGMFVVGWSKKNVSDEAAVAVYSLADGTLSKLAELNHDDSKGYAHSIVALDSSHFAITYSDYYNDLQVKTFSYFEGTITQLSHIEVEPGSFYQDTTILKLDDGHLLAMGNSGSELIMYTVSYDGSWQLTPIDSQILASRKPVDSTKSSYSSVMVDSTHFALVYNEVDSDTVLTIGSVNGAYVIALGASVEMNDGAGGEIWASSASLIDSTHILVSMRETVAKNLMVVDLDGSYIPSIVETFGITGYGTFGVAMLDSSTMMAMNVSTSDYDLWAMTYTIDGSYQIAATGESLEYYTTPTAAYSPEFGFALQDESTLLSFWDAQTADLNTFLSVFVIEGESTFIPQITIF